MPRPVLVRLASALRTLGAVLGLSLLVLAHASAIGLGDIKKKAKDKVEDKIDDKVDKKLDEAIDPDGTPKPGAQSPASGSDAGGAGDASGDDVPISQVSTKFDFVPGDKVIFMDDFAADEVGEFPARWRLDSGNLDVAEFEGRKWLRLAGNTGVVEMKLDGPLPERWTLEFDLHAEKGAGILDIHAKDAEGADLWWVHCGVHGNDVASGFNKKESLSTLPVGDFGGHHRISVSADGRKLKFYVDRERVVNAPEIEWATPPVKLSIRLGYPDVQPLIGNVRFAERSAPKEDLLAVPFVTHGIYFDSGSDRVKPESAPVLRQIAAYLTTNAAVRVMITGHTDDVGQDDANLDLSKRRAAAVKDVLAADFAIDAARVETDGKGEGAPLAKNDSTEGRATNRRVEFAKVE